MVSLLLFGPLRERVGRAELAIPIDGPVTVKTILDVAEREYPGLRRWMADLHVAIAVNSELISDRGNGAVTMVADRDEVALLPPFSGGSSESFHPPVGREGISLLHPPLNPIASQTTVPLIREVGDGVRIQPGPFSLEAEVGAVKGQSSQIGPVVAFTGSVRDLSDGRAVLGIEVEVYPVMAMKRLEQIRLEAIYSFSLLEARIVVRQGRLTIGDDLVLIIAAAEHRQEAFLASRWCIDKIKRSVPIWKRELTNDGWKWVKHGC